MTLVEFLRARLDEDERAAQAGQHSQVVAMVARQSGKRNALNFWYRHDPARVLAEVDAKRRIVDELLWLEGNANNEPVVADYCAPIILRLLALPYADHSDYDSAWRP